MQSRLATKLDCTLILYPCYMQCACLIFSAVMLSLCSSLSRCLAAQYCLNWMHDALMGFSDMLSAGPFKCTQERASQLGCSMGIPP